jgi:hypothetical protein
MPCWPGARSPFARRVSTAAGCRCRPRWTARAQHARCRRLHARDAPGAPAADAPLLKAGQPRWLLRELGGGLHAAGLRTRTHRGALQACPTAWCPCGGHRHGRCRMWPTCKAWPPALRRPPRHRLPAAPRPARGCARAGAPPGAVPTLRRRAHDHAPDHRPMLITEPNLERPDDFYEALLADPPGPDADQSHDAQCAPGAAAGQPHRPSTC